MRYMCSVRIAAGTLYPEVAGGKPRQKPWQPVFEFFAYRLAFVQRWAQTDVGDILKIATSDDLNDELSPTHRL